MYSLVGLVVIALFFLPLFIKRKRQLGKTWRGVVRAKIDIAQVPLACLHCKSDSFHKREALIPTTFLILFGLNVFNQSGAAYECAKCGFIHWFSRPRETAVELVRDWANEKGVIEGEQSKT